MAFAFKCIKIISVCRNWSVIKTEITGPLWHGINLGGWNCRRTELQDAKWNFPATLIQSLPSFFFFLSILKRECGTTRRRNEHSQRTGNADIRFDYSAGKTVESSVAALLTGHSPGLVFLVALNRVGWLKNKCHSIMFYHDSWLYSIHMWPTKLIIIYNSQRIKTMIPILFFFSFLF